MKIQSFLRIPLLFLYAALVGILFLYVVEIFSIALWVDIPFLRHGGEISLSKLTYLLEPSKHPAVIGGIKVLIFAAIFTCLTVYSCSYIAAGWRRINRWGNGELRPPKKHTPKC